jgi:thiosulfate dehydrogenase [quinone] large subunit
MAMTTFQMDRRVVLALRLLVGWLFLYAGAWQVLSPEFTVAGFLSTTKTFHNLYAPLTAPAIAPLMTFLVSYGHLLIGLSLVSGLLVRVSGVFGVFLMLTYWTAHMDWPFIENHNSLFVDYHIVYAVLLGWMVAVGAGQAYGLDGWLSTRFRGTLPGWLIAPQAG